MEHLRSLCSEELRAVHCPSGNRGQHFTAGHIRLLDKNLHSVHTRNDRYQCRRGFSLLKHPCHHVAGNQRADSVMNGNDSPCRNSFQCILHRMKTGYAAFHQNLRTCKLAPIAIVFPVIYVCLWQHGNDSHIRTCGCKDFNRSLKYGFSSQFKELFRFVSSHSGTAAGAHHYQKLSSAHSSLFYIRYDHKNRNYLTYFSYFCCFKLINKKRYIKWHFHF